MTTTTNTTTNMLNYLRSEMDATATPRPETAFPELRWTEATTVQRAFIFELEETLAVDSLKGILPSSKEDISTCLARKHLLKCNVYPGGNSATEALSSSFSLEINRDIYNINITPCAGGAIVWTNASISVKITAYVR